MSLISIIIPIYNTQKYISKCLDALIAQTFKDIEILCIDDGSTDNSLNILQEYEKKDGRIKVFTQENSGPATARNVGLQNAKGKYIMFCDSDDWYESAMCEDMHNCIEKENVDIVMCDCNIVDTQSKHSRTSGDGDYAMLKLKDFHNISDDCSLMLNLILWNKIFKKSLIDRYDISFPNGYLHDDDSFIRQYLSVALSYFGLDKRLYNYVFRKNSIMDKTFSLNDNPKKFDKFHSLSYFYFFLVKNNLFELKSKYFLQCLANDMGFCWHLTYKDGDRTQIIKLINAMIKDIDANFFPESIEHVLIAIKNNDIEKAKKLSSKIHGSKKTVSLFGFEIFKKEKNAFFKRVYIFGILLYTKKYR
jgi:glycosyltransferase involved in cell wall biosynthesis